MHPAYRVKLQELLFKKQKDFFAYLSTVPSKGHSYCGATTDVASLFCIQYTWIIFSAHMFFYDLSYDLLR